MKWNEKRNTLEDWGKPPMLIEPVGGSVTLRGLAGAWTAQPLDGAGRPMGKAVPLTAADGGAVLRLEAPTTWHLITR